ncbi:MAG: hypothetical protein ACLFR0_06990 [Alphaproteobacteria bacterium]
MSAQRNNKHALQLSGFLALCLLLTAGAFFLYPTKDACAQIAATPCDPDYYQSLEQRAWLEAQREITQNQNLITKPDSVLAYTCFEGYLFELADHADEMFSETTRWGASVLGGAQDESMNNALERLVLEAMQTYMDANFLAPGDLRMLGGRSSTDRIDVGGYTDISNGMSYSCDLMQRIWLEAKCYNFQEEPDDGFFTFTNYETTPDKRAFPERCRGTAPAGGLGSVYQTARQEAGLDIATGPPWPIDFTYTYMDRFDPTYPGVSDCGTFPPIQTGVEVRRAHSSINDYDEHVCVMAGCHFRPPSSGPTPPSPGPGIPGGWPASACHP